MRIEQIALKNFMPFWGQQTIVFPSFEDRNVSVVFADNMRGKTSLLNAVRWCLYGTALGRHLRPLNLAEMVNVDAAAEGDWEISVQLRFTHKGARHEMTRQASLRRLVERPRNAGDFEVHVTLVRDGDVVRADEVEHAINQIVPERVSRFFLFDGELLQEYENLLADVDEQGKRIKESVEQVLGVPALLNGRRHLSSLLRKAQQKQAKEIKSVESVRGLAEEQLRLEEHLDILRTDLGSLKQEEEVLRDQIDELEDELERTTAVQKAKQELDTLDRRQEDLSQQEREIEQHYRDVLSGAWKDLLVPHLEARVRALESMIRERREVDQHVAVLKSKLASLQATLANATCGACGSPLHDDRRTELEERVVETKEHMSKLSQDVQPVHHASEELAQLHRISGSDAEKHLLRLEAARDKTLVEMTKVEARIIQLNDEIRGQDTTEIARKRDLRDNHLRTQGRISEAVRKKQVEIEKHEREQREIAKTISKHTDARAVRATLEVDTYRALEEVFSESVAILRDRLKRTVERLATETFRRLTTEKTYSGLRINDSYGLNIIDGEGRVVSIRSAGAEQIVALSLIDGLNRTSQSSGPIIMDTPLGRLDLKHRTAVLAEIPNMAEQVVLFVHEGEIRKRDGLQPLASRLASVFEIERVSSSRSRVVRASSSF